MTWGEVWGQLATFRQFFTGKGFICPFHCYCLNTYWPWTAAAKKKTLKRHEEIFWRWKWKVSGQIWYNTVAWYNQRKYEVDQKIKSNVKWRKQTSSLLTWSLESANQISVRWPLAALPSLGLAVKTPFNSKTTSGPPTVASLTRSLKTCGIWKLWTPYCMVTLKLYFSFLLQNYNWREFRLLTFCLSELKDKAVLWAGWVFN